LKPCVEAIVRYTQLEDIELIIVANGCTDETKEYLQYLYSYFRRTNIGDFKPLFSGKPLGYSKANNLGIRAATTDKIILLNNDAFLLEQPKNTWLQMLNAPFERDPNCGISYVLKNFSGPAGQDFAVFFCVMVHRKVFDKIGLLNEEYGKGGGEDTELCIEAQRAGFTMLQCGEQTWSAATGLNTGAFPIYHKGEGTVHDKSLVPDWDEVFWKNSLKLSYKYNPAWAKEKLGTK
jgi:GT2 family glycosyltransferase